MFLKDRLHSMLIDPFSVPLDENHLVDWLVDANAGDAVAYYRGHLAHDRCMSTPVLTSDERRRLIAVANRIMAASDQGLVTPLQRRVGPHEWLYLAVRSSGRLQAASVRSKLISPAALLAA
ncbi:MAG: hypothetical protein Q8M31_23990 [Beijerinckiaceae bacterium]|nr:hypothetical protein [Beijerinckiaceae bacterium]